MTAMARMGRLTAAESFWYVLGCIGFGAMYFCKVPVKKALSEAGLAQMTGAEQFWYVLQCLAFGAGYFAKIPVKKALTELAHAPAGGYQPVPALDYHQTTAGRSRLPATRPLPAQTTGPSHRGMSSGPGTASHPAKDKNSRQDAMADTTTHGSRATRPGIDITSAGRADHHHWHRHARRRSGAQVGQPNRWQTASRPGGVCRSQGIRPPTMTTCTSQHTPGKRS